MGSLMARKKKALKKKARKAKSGNKIAGRSRAIRGVTGVRDVSSDHKVDIGPPNSRETW
jgi:hypothetical protein